MITIEELGLDRADQIMDLVAELLDELNQDESVSAGFDRHKVVSDWRDCQDRFTAFVALDEQEKPLGIITLTEAFALYAEGNFGIINELYVLPESRGQSVGAMLVETAKEYGKFRHWKRIDVTAPLGEKWERTVKFYEREGFAHTGSKLKFKY